MIWPEAPEPAMICENVGASITKLNSIVRSIFVLMGEVFGPV
jgi:hypothetical protein